MCGGIRIKQYENPHIGKIIKELREHRGMSQEALAQEAFFSRSTLSQIELGNQECPEDTLSAIKMALNIEHLPLRDAERPEFRDMLHKWCSVISERNVEESKVLRKKLAIIKLLPHDRELNRLFSLFDCKYHLLLNDLIASKKVMEELKDDLDELSDIQLYHYYYNLGMHNVISKQYQAALKFYLKAYELMNHGFEKNLTLYFYIAYCYHELGYVARATAFLEEVCKYFDKSLGNIPELSVYCLLGTCYIRTGLLQRSKIWLDKAFTIATNEYKANENSYTKEHLGIILLNYGLLYRMAKKWNIAIEYFDKAFTYLDEDNDNYLETLYQKTRTTIEKGNSLFCNNLLAKGIKLSKGNEIYAIMFEALKLIITPSEESAKLFETKIIPFLLENDHDSLLLDYCSFLRDYYKSKGKGFKTRALDMSDIICNVYLKMHEGGIN